VFPDLVVKLAIFVLVTLCVGGVVWALFYSRLSGQAEVEKRVGKVVEAAPVRRAAREARQDGDKRRKQIEDTIKDIDQRNNRIAKNPPLAVRLQQAGLGWSKRTFWIVSAVTGVGFLIAAQVLGGQILISLGIGFAAAFGFPRWFLGFAKKRRLAKFLHEFPNAVDVIVRGVKAGLPLADCIRVVSQESEEPVRSEFKAIIETQAIGIPLADAVERLYERVPVSEANFFAIVISVQQRSGGNLSEILGNLSKVLRDRKKMKMKINALSQEAKASAAIIASLPVIVMILVYMSSPDYISMLWTTSTGQFLLMCSAGWMTLGVLVMRKMINFDF
jgi:tight adherence protein B